MAAATFADYVVRFAVLVGPEGRRVVKERGFKTEAARTRFVDRQWELGVLVEVLAYSDPQ